MKIESQTSIKMKHQRKFQKLFKKFRKRSKKQDSKLDNVHPEKIYDSYVKMDAFRRELYEIDLLSQNLMDAYRLYAAYAYQAMATLEPQLEELKRERVPEWKELRVRILSTGDLVYLPAHFMLTKVNDDGSISEYCELKEPYIAGC